MSTAQTNESTENNDLVTITIGGNDLRFDVSTADFNQYLNEQTPQNKVSPAYNFLQRTVVKEDKDSFKQVVMRNKAPNGAVVMQIASAIALDFGADIDVTVKK
jgi:lysophospholipase L1-like esterase